MRVVFCGTAAFAVPSLQRLLADGHQVLAVLTQPDRPAGRGRRLRASPVKQAALAAGLPLLQPARASAPEVVAELERLAPELLLVAAFGQLLSARVLAVPRLGAVNLHPSLLPRYRGAAPIARAILAGESETGLTTIWMNERMDAGDIILQQPSPISPHHTTGSLTAELAQTGAALLSRTLAAIAQGTAPRCPQPESEATYAPALTKQQARLDWGRPAQELGRLVRAASPIPGAYAYHLGRRLIVCTALPTPQVSAGIPGQVVEIRKEGVLVRVGEDALLLQQVRPENARTMTAWEYALGHPLRAGDMMQ